MATLLHRARQQNSRPVVDDEVLMEPRLVLGAGTPQVVLVEQEQVSPRQGGRGGTHHVQPELPVSIHLQGHPSLHAHHVAVTPPRITTSPDLQPHRKGQEGHWRDARQQVEAEVNDLETMNRDMLQQLEA